MNEKDVLINTLKRHAEEIQQEETNSMKIKWKVKSSTLERRNYQMSRLWFYSKLKTRSEGVYKEKAYL